MNRGSFFPDNSFSWGTYIKSLDIFLFRQVWQNLTGVGVSKNNTSQTLLDLSFSSWGSTPNWVDLSFKWCEFQNKYTLSVAFRWPFSAHANTTLRLFLNISLSCSSKRKTYLRTVPRPQNLGTMGSLLQILSQGLNNGFLFRLPEQTAHSQSPLSLEQGCLLWLPFTITGVAKT